MLGMVLMERLGCTLGGFMTMAVQIWPFTLEQRLMEASLYSSAATSSGTFTTSR